MNGAPMGTGPTPNGAGGFAPTSAGGMGLNIASTGATRVTDEEKKHKIIDIIQIVAIVILSLTTATFVGLFIWMFTEYDAARTDVDGQIAVAVAEAKNEQALKLEEEFLEREKYPYKVFSGPADYGQLTFEYPRTWSVYVDADAAKGGDFKAYFNPVQVNEVADSTINSLRVSILNESFDKVAADYEKEMNKKNSNLTMQAVTIGAAGVAANRYTGTIPKTDLSGYIVIFKIRDKTAILQTDSVLFQADFDRLLSTVEFNA